MDSSGLAWQVERDDEGKVYYVNKDQKIASTYDKPSDYVPMWEEVEGVAGGVATMWRNLVSGEVVDLQPPELRRLPPDEPAAEVPNEEGAEKWESWPWTEHEDEASGQPWWRNHETNDETWVRPWADGE